MDKYQKVTLGFAIVLAAVTGARVIQLKQEVEHSLQQKAAKLVDCVNKSEPLPFIAGTSFSNKPAAWLDLNTSIPIETNGSRLELITTGKERIGGPSCWLLHNGRLPCSTGPRSYRYKLNVDYAGVGTVDRQEQFGPSGQIPSQSGLDIASQVRQVVRNCQLSL